jgi:hypothetical protein
MWPKGIEPLTRMHLSDHMAAHQTPTGKPFVAVRSAGHDAPEPYAAIPPKRLTRPAQGQVQCTIIQAGRLR